MIKQFNYLTNQEYQGHNQIDLLSAKAKNVFTSDAWLTFLQAKQSGLMIKKGSHGVGILSPFLNGQKEVKQPNGKVETVEYHIPRHYTVFNLDQTNNV